MTDFPEIVYRVPGPHFGADGRGWAYKGVHDADEMAAALAEGWHLTFAEALAAAIEAEKADNSAEINQPSEEMTAEAVLAEVQEAQEAVEAVTPATREELEAKARELGVSFNARTRDEVLAERIASAL